MRLTTEQIKRMIKEELNGILKESDMGFSIEKLEPLLLDQSSLYGHPKYMAKFNQGLYFLEMLEDGEPGIANKILDQLIARVDEIIKNSPKFDHTLLYRKRDELEELKKRFKPKSGE